MHANRAVEPTGTLLRWVANIFLSQKALLTIGGYFAKRTGIFLTNIGTDGADYAIEHFFG